MARCILIFGQPASGKTFSLRNLPPAESIIVDADKKGALSWRGAKAYFNTTQRNFYSFNQLDRIIQLLRAVESPDFAHIRFVAIDGFNNAMMNEVMFFEDVNRTNNKFEKYSAVAKKVVKIIDAAQSLREGVNVIFTAHVETADPAATGDVDKVFTPGKFIKDKIKLESKFNYVFYARIDDTGWYFETAPNNSTARSPFDCFPQRIDNDILSAINTIDLYESGDDVD